jgi:dienelactone hydrolase
MMSRLTLAAFALLTACTVHATDSRTAFLQLLERPRVPLAAEVGIPAAKDDLVEIAFSYATVAGQRVTGILVKSASSPAPASPPARRPAVVVLHGTGGNKEAERALLMDYARVGLVGVAIDGRYHGARAQGGKAAKATEYVAAILRTFRTGQEHPFFFDTAWDVMRLIDYLETRDDIDPRRIGLMGFSKGGIETYLAAAADPRVAVSVSCIGVQSFRWALDNNSWQSRISTVQAAFNTAAKESGIATPDADFVRTFYARVAPGIDGAFDGPAMLPLIAPRPLLAINGGTDARTPLPGLQLCADAARAAYHAAGADEKFMLRVQPNTGHKVNPDSMVAAREWLVRWLKP